MPKYGDINPGLTKAINRIAKAGSGRVGFWGHALDAMDDDGFDHADVMECLRRGKAFGPELQKNELRANVVHRNLQLRVSVRGLDEAQDDWSALESITVVTVMKET
jgi:hypothetical protein